MLSLGSSGRFEGNGVSTMEDNELEEGEACFYQEEDPNCDPDTAFSYIDVKLQDVLGHFQKEFEGGVSAENLAYFSYYSSSSFKKMDHSSTSEVHVSATMAPQPFPGVPMDTDAGLLPQGACLVPQVPDVMKENWIMCDECEKWRLLPYGMDSSKPLPKKWFCRMLDWLPNMNRCDIGEDETAQALNAMYGIQPGQGQIEANKEQGQIEANKEQLPLPGAPHSELVL